MCIENYSGCLHLWRCNVLYYVPEAVLGGVYCVSDCVVCRSEFFSASSINESLVDFNLLQSIHSRMKNSKWTLQTVRLGERALMAIGERLADDQTQ